MNLGPKLKEVLQDTIVHTSRAAIGASHSLGVMSHLRKRWNEGKLFDMMGSGVKFSTMGKVMVAGWGVKSMFEGAKEGYEESRLGTPSGEMLTSTPQPRYTQFFSADRNDPTNSMAEVGAQMINEANYYNSAVDMGATGDLVFAMNRNRRG